MSNPGCIAPFLPFSLPPFESQSSRLLAFGVDARILNLRLITVFTSYSPARSLARLPTRTLPSVRPSWRGSCSCCRSCCWKKRRRCCCSCCTSCLARPLPARAPARPPAPSPPRGMLPLGAGPLPPSPGCGWVLPFLSGRFFFPYVR